MNSSYTLEKLLSQSWNWVGVGGGGGGEVEGDVVGVGEAVAVAEAQELGLKESDVADDEVFTRVVRPMETMENDNKIQESYRDDRHTLLKTLSCRDSIPHRCYLSFLWREISLLRH
jgi:hypothetical protein